MPTPLETKLRERIQSGERIDVSQFMHTALLDPEHGYYTNRKVFGKDGDFITAPDVSQIFGEVIAAYLTANILGAALTEPATLVEFGPGRGTLMHDMLRSFKSMPAELNLKEVVLVEASQKLIDIQKDHLKDSHIPIRWVASATELPQSPCYIVANEFFDALPIRQFVSKGEEWHEKVLEVKHDKLEWKTTEPSNLSASCHQFISSSQRRSRSMVTASANGKIDPGLHRDDGMILEYPEAGIHTMHAMSKHIAAHGGMLVAIDYGHTEHAFGDTLQAVKQHQCVEVLSNIGEADITAHVNFTLMKEVAQDAGLKAHILTTQGKFLRSLGAELRAMALCEGLDKNGQVDIASGLERLISPMQMGELFKVLVVANTQIDVLELGV